MKTALRATLFGSLVALVAGGIGCATVEVERGQLLVENRSRHLVQAIKYRRCDDSESGYSAIPNTTLRAGHRVAIDVDQPCIDVLAVDERDRVLGKQDRLRIPPKATWLIR
jgi:hypothetical protein